MRYPEIKKIASKLRKNQTDAEKKLWSYLRYRQHSGKKYLRQHPIIYERRGNELFFYIPDFYCAEEKLAIELDGKIHDYQKERDLHRDLILEAKEIRVLRIKNEELTDIQKVLNKISTMYINIDE